MTLAVTLSGNPVGFRAGTFTLDDVVDERTVASFTVRDDNGSLSPTRGDPVVVTDGGTVLFRGFVEAPTTVRVGTGPMVEHDIRAVDGHYLADKRRAAVVYEDQTVAAIVTDLHSRYLDAEGVTLGTVDTGPLVRQIVFPWVSVAEALSTLADAAGFWWYIKPTVSGFELEFRQREAFAAPFAITGNNILANPTPQVRRQAPDYRNVQYVRGVRERTDTQTETFLGDGETRTFTVGFRIAEVPTVQVNGTAQTVGIRGLDEGDDWYWNKDDRTISQDQSGTKLTSSDVLSVTYVGFFDAVIISRNQDAIDERLAVEGGTGKVESVLIAGDTEGRAAAFDLAAAKLAKYGHIGKTVTFDTRLSGLRAGMLLDVNLADLQVGSGMLVASVTTADHAGSELRYRVTAVEGPHEETWARFFARMYEVPDVLVPSQNISEDEVLTRLFEQDKTWDDTDVQPANFWYEVWPANGLATSTSLYPQIDRDHWMTYIEWWDDTEAVGRKQATARTLSASEIESTFYLSPSEANIAVDTLKFYGGIAATGALQSGDLAVTVALNETKTTAEAWQIVRTDTRAGTPPDWWEIGDVPA